jgi:hypothetical protein
VAFRLGMIPVESIVTAAILAVVPYAILRSVVNRLWNRSQVNVSG